MDKDPLQKDPFNELMKPFDAFFGEKPLKGFLQSIDELFNKSLPFQSFFQVKTSETDSEYLVVAELPGVKKEQIEIDILDRYLTISVQSREELTEEDDKQKTYRSQQSWQRSSRTIPFPQPISETKVKASYENGMLQISIPKIKGKQIYLD
ncbi:Hsp20/alpha crystallin family protein [Niallia sp. Krafla_26]|uniref:Hsp20/alpha crystallin family protein n=1 Tax=Niallia sp. Krafla_26 TaxID=3064703 RepID=UPI003D186EA1